MSPILSRATRLDWLLLKQLVAGGRVIPLTRLRLYLYFDMPRTAPHAQLEQCWLDTGAPVTVIPFHVHDQRLVWHSLGFATTWRGQPCTLGVIDVWFPALSRSSSWGPVSLVAKFAQSDPPGDPVPILLGLEFFLAYQAHLVLSPPPAVGTIQMP